MYKCVSIVRSGRDRAAGALLNGGGLLEGTIEFRARYSETDQMGVIHHRIYLVWCEMGRTELLRQLGASYADLERQGIKLAVSGLRFSYRASARYDDLVRVRTTLKRLQSRAVSFAYVVEDAASSALLVEAETDHVCIGSDGAVRTLPTETYRLLKRAQQLASEEGTTDAPSGV